MKRITILTSPDCALCDHAKAVLGRLEAEYPLVIETIPLDSEYGQRLAQECQLLFPPGILINDEPFSWGRLSERKLRRAIEN